MPGDVSLAHHGMLLLDELPEFRRHVVEVLRQALEKDVVTITSIELGIMFPVDLNSLEILIPYPSEYAEVLKAPTPLAHSLSANSVSSKSYTLRYATK
jgi:predicted ATPase with chaperone activity